MPYSSNADLPERVKKHLPAHAQDIFRKAFNSAYHQYGRDESKAFAVAWAAVKRKYTKKDGKWVKKKSGLLRIACNKKKKNLLKKLRRKVSALQSRLSSYFGA